MVLDIYGNLVSRNNPFLDVIRELDKRKDVKINLMGPVHPSLLHIQKRKYIAGDIAIGFGTPREFLGMLREQYRLKLGYISWETNKVPYGELYGSRSILDKLDLLLVPNKWNQKLFEHVRTPSEVVPLPFSKWVVPQARSEDDIFTFLCEGTLILKHNVGLIVSAFLSLYKDNLNVQLILKTDSGTLGHLQFPYPNLHIIDQIYKPKEILKLYRETDCFIYPSSADATPLSLINALAADLPAIISSHSNFDELPGIKLKKHELTKAERYSEKFGDVGNYWSVDYEELKTAMKNAVENLKLPSYGPEIRQKHNVNSFVNHIIKLKEKHYDRIRESTQPNR